MSSQSTTVLKPYAKEHDLDSLAGPGDARPTALQIVRDQNLVGKLTGKVMLVTGSGSGIGVETVRALHTTGADVYMAVRSIERADPVQKEIAGGEGSGKVELVEMSLDSFESVKRGAKDFLQRSGGKLNVLVNNAGVMACPESYTVEGHEMQFGTNHLGHFLLFQELKSALLVSSTPEYNSRVISVSSTGHRGMAPNFDDLDMKKMGYHPWKAYQASKTANVWFANELDRRYGSQGLHALSLHPGFIATPLQRHLDPAFIAKAMENTAAVKYFKNTEQGAATSVWCAVAKEWEGKGGRYCEECQESEPVDPKDTSELRRGHVSHAYDEAREEKLWVESLKLVRAPDDQ